MDKRFNLLHEQWIKVMTLEGKIEEVSVLELFERSHNLKGLAGEMPTQDIAVLRFLLAILHAVVARYDINGNFIPLDSENPEATPALVLKRWQSYWENGSLDLAIVKDYLLDFEDRFFLLHPEHPFYQVPEMKKATEYVASKLNGELSESTNKPRLFPQRTGDGKMSMSYGEAARWLPCTIAFDDTSAKPTVKGLGSPGAGWLGQIGIIYAVGNSLFETLLYNLVLLPDGEDRLWDAEMPVWEKPCKTDERTPILLPNNPSELLTIQSRRLNLKSEGNKIVGFKLLGGDYFPRENAFSEQMTLWRNDVKRASDTPLFVPKRHRAERFLWRDFSSLIVQSENQMRPGVVNWLRRLKNESLITLSTLRFSTPLAEYGDKNFFINNISSDSLSFNIHLLSSIGEAWSNRIINEISVTESLVKQLGYFAKNVAIASGHVDGNPQQDETKQQAFFQLDQPFKRWLEAIDPEKNNKDETCELWWSQGQNIVRSIARDVVKKTGLSALKGRKDKLTAAEAYNLFLFRTQSREKLMEKAKK